MAGFIKLYRKIEDHWVWKKKPFSPGQAWIDLLLLATYRDSKFIKRGIMVDLDPGQIGVSMKGLSDRWGWSRTKVKNFLKILKNEHQIEHQIDNITSIITILNWSDYQIQDTNQDTRKTPERHQKDTIKNIKKVKKEKNGSTSIYNKKLSFFLDSFKKENPGLYCEAMYDEFQRYWSEPDKHGTEKWAVQLAKPNGTWSLAGRLAKWAASDYNGHHAAHLKAKAAARKEQEAREEREKAVREAEEDPIDPEELKRLIRNVGESLMA